MIRAKAVHQNLQAMPAGRARLIPKPKVVEHDAQRQLQSAGVRMLRAKSFGDDCQRSFQVRAAGRGITKVVEYVPESG